MASREEKKNSNTAAEVLDETGNDEESNDFCKKKQVVADTPSDDDSNDASCLFDEIALLLFLAINIYGLADLRKFARQGKLKGDPALADKLLTLPINRVETAKLFRDNAEDLKKVMKTDLYLTAMERMGKELLELHSKQKQQSQDDATSMSTTKQQETKQQQHTRRRRQSMVESVIMMSKQTKKGNDQDDGDDDDDDANAGTMEVFDDGINNTNTNKNNNTKVDQLVYMIAVNRTLGQLKLVFRGSVTVRDFTHDADSFLVRQPNPLYHDASISKKKQKTTIPQAKTIGIHQGFYSYLFKKPKTKSTSAGEGGQKSKYETILDHLDRLRQEYPGYKVSVTGHSLGGALATLFTYQAAVDNRFGCITCIVFASPRVGNFRFVRSFHELELAGKIRYLRVTNDKDVIPKMPDRPCLPTHMTVYHHAGLELRLFRNGAHKFHYPTMCKSRSRLHQYQAILSLRYFRPPVWCSLTHFYCQDILRWHGCAEYMDRLDNIQSDELQEMNLRDLLKKSHEEAK